MLVQTFLFCILLTTGPTLQERPDGSDSTWGGSAQEPPRQVEAVRRDLPVVIDGQLEEEAWNSAVELSGFRQRDPDEGALPTEATSVYVLYDDEALYVGARLYDAYPDSITARLGRRDAELDTDMFGFYIDPYNDGRTGFYFGVSAAGALYDGVMMNDDWDDDSWDGVWDGSVHVDDQGWTAELRVPYSQLRFKAADEYTWGINFLRVIARKKEWIYLVYTPRSESGFVSRFPDLVGVKDIRPPRQLEVIPYVTAKAHYREAEAGNPFRDGSSYTPDVGADLRVGITNNLTLNATVNPDFGQVEVDPAVVNLSDYETFFPEKRPFFIEGASVFNFGHGGATQHWGFNWGNPDFFYTRRIGRAPQGSLPDADYQLRPDGTRILGAAKLTGKVAGGWNVGTVHAMTQRTWAELMADGRKFQAEVEPRSYYGVARAQREWRDGRQGLGVIGTLTERQFQEDRLLSEINTGATTWGVDGWTFLDEQKTWVVTGWAGYSRVRGSQEQITNLQRSSLHYFQRPDADHVRVDSSATSLSGFAGRVLLNKERGHVLMNAAFGFISPGFDVNDIGFQWRGDYVNGHLGVGYRWTDPTRYFRNMTVIGAAFKSMDFEGNTVWQGVWGLFDIQFLNYYGFEIRAAYNPPTLDSRRTRGGPLTRSPAGGEVSVGARSDSRKPWVFGLRTGGYFTEDGDSRRVITSVEWKPAANMSFSLNPSIGWNQENAQWVDAFDDPYATTTYGKRYVFAELDQITLSSSVRMDWTFTPQLSFQLFAQPLLSVGDYERYKMLARSGSYDFTVLGEGGSTIDEASLVADPDGAGPAASIDLPKRDFNFKSLRGTAVVRWEFRPGSTLYFVWTQQRSDSQDIGSFRFGSDMGRLWDAQPDNIFMVKLTYWLSR